MELSHATAFLYALKPRGIRFGLENTRLVLEKLGNPERRFQSLHIAGSNGKGSTCAFLDAMLRQGGFHVGFYSSPHLIHFRERFQIDGQPVSDEAIERNMDRLVRDGLDLDPAEVTAWVKRENMVSRMEQSRWYHERGGASRFTRLTFFECATVLALLLFAEAGVEFAVMETGMGGRLDATNVLTPLVSVITPIHLEHTAWLGKTLGAIAAEKAGIIKPSIPVVSARQHPEARAVIAQEARNRNAPLSMMGVDFDTYGGWRSARFSVAEKQLGPVHLGLVGEHQLVNAATALACTPWLAAAGWPLREDSVLEGLRTVTWPGRFERFGRSGEWVLDGAHNPEAVAALTGAMRDVFANRSIRLVFGVLKDKEVEQMLPQLLPMAHQVELVHPADSRGRDPNSLLPLVGRAAQIHPSVSSAMEKLHGEPGAPVLVTGSLTVVGEARAWLLNRGVLPTSIPEFALRMASS